MLAFRGIATVKSWRSFVILACVWSLVVVSAPAADAGSRAGGTRGSSCPANPQPTARHDLPPKLKPYSDTRLIGERALWTIAPRDPRYVGDAGRWMLGKQPWFRLNTRQLIIDARRIDGGSGTFRAEVPPMAAYPLDMNLHIGPGFIPSSLEFSTGGCWKVTATLGRSKVVLHVNIDDSTVS